MSAIHLSNRFLSIFAVLLTLLDLRYLLLRSTHNWPKHRLSSTHSCGKMMWSREYGKGHYIVQAEPIFHWVDDMPKARSGSSGG